MSPIIKKPDTDRVLKQLKDFQRETVDYVFNRMYLDDDCTTKFLVADEVGLGKTLVARGIIAKTIDFLWDKVDRLDVVYVCSNGDIARQNINRLNVTGHKDFSLSSRITLLPLQLEELQNKKLNFVSFTPGTSFDLKGNVGRSKERQLLFWLLKDFLGYSDAKGTCFFTGYADIDRFRWHVDNFEVDSINDEIRMAFLKRMQKEKKLAKQLRMAINDVPRAGVELDDDLRKRVNRLIGSLRKILAETCLNKLEPDLIILDEFQRFKDLLHGERDDASEAALLAKELFDFQLRDDDPATAARVLLLSATPYKMYTVKQESDDHNHYEDFQSTIEFLMPKKQLEAFKEDLSAYRNQMYRVSENGLGQLVPIKKRLESSLKKVMVRTERLATGDDRNGMLRQIDFVPKVTANDIRGYLALQKIGEQLGSRDLMEFWKSSPYLLNFMEDYDVKHKLIKTVKSETYGVELTRAVKAAKSNLLNHSELEAYQKIDPGNARLRSLNDDIVERGAWRLLWIPSSMPYYQPEGAFAEVSLQGLTKRLVFSSWQVVPKAIASYLSYEAERRMIRSHETAPENTVEARKGRRPLIRFSLSEERLTAMSALTLVYPCQFLAESFDPLQYYVAGTVLPSLAEIKVRIESDLREEVHQLTEGFAEEGGVDERWYWAAPVLLDIRKKPSSRDWFNQENLAGIWSRSAADDKEAAKGWSHHVDELLNLVRGNIELGRPPADLARVLTEVAIGSPSVAALRSLTRISLGTIDDTNIRNASARLGHSFLSTFNSPEATSVVRSQSGKPYWQAILAYCCEGNLQSMLDEYCHILVESLGLIDKSSLVVSEEVSDAVDAALTLRTTRSKVDMISAKRKIHLDDSMHLRNHFAMRFGDQPSDDGSEKTRQDQVRIAFNSPFWPFVLSSTSVGQEGLDFHCYCHAIVHWNLPGNPVDLEQREGRIHRYKGHALRKNIAEVFSQKITDPKSDPWAQMFDYADENRPSSQMNQLYPFWVMDKGAAKIERHVPVIPLSREVQHLAKLKNSLVLYRMVFGQNRQEDIVEYLRKQLTEEQLLEFSRICRIELSPSRNASLSTTPELIPNEISNSTC